MRADFDNDGDADMISVYILGSYYIYYKNLAKELFNRCDTLIMETQNNCFGQLYLGSVNNTATLGVSCRMANPDLVSQAEQEMKIDTGVIRDGGNCTYAFDYNHDGNFDLYVGDKLASSLMKLQNGGGNVMDALTYWGSNNYDQAYFLELDHNDDVYIFGQTNAPSGELIDNAPYNIPAGGQFITKLDQSLSTLLLSSRIGKGDGTPDISPTAFLVDVCDKIYTSGWGSSAADSAGR